MSWKGEYVTFCNILNIPFIPETSKFVSLERMELVVLSKVPVWSWMLLVDHFGGWINRAPADDAGQSKGQTKSIQWTVTATEMNFGGLVDGWMMLLSDRNWILGWSLNGCWRVEWWEGGRRSHELGWLLDFVCAYGCIYCVVMHNKTAQSNLKFTAKMLGKAFELYV